MRILFYFSLQTVEDFYCMCECLFEIQRCKDVLLSEYPRQQGQK